jgi:hypothetical protein
MGTGMPTLPKKHPWRIQWKSPDKRKKRKQHNKVPLHVQSWIDGLLRFTPPEEDCLEDFRLDGCPATSLEHRQWPEEEDSPPTCRRCGGPAEPLQMGRYVYHNLCRPCLDLMCQLADQKKPLDIEYPKPPGYIEPLLDLE